ncbi:MAG: hypothetical protein KC461_00205 [Dehalococcoidia bacterium]|nr:hypothetical protein [Dehalococcoidia bacterium]MCB9490989.1 hypothetical protein [Dehalococcoidia bacterium]
MEWVVLAAVAALVALFVAWPRRGDADPVPVAVADLRDERAALLDELREIDEDALAGRITAEDRLDARRQLGQRLRSVTEALRDLGESPDVAPPARASAPPAPGDEERA